MNVVGLWVGTVVNIIVIESAKPFFSTAAVMFPMPSSRAAIMPATIRRCRPTEHVSPGFIPGPHPCSQNKTSVKPSNSHFSTLSISRAHHKLALLVSSVSGIVARNLSWYDRGTSSGE